ncbi:uncharacterized protein LOC143565671 [Bidens hawaiensis]|uniref:uncharacterized protein LOC143565671 n=1 Tax=Bidens hawaiensis TaxID=980011 RepID=UPI0040494E03
MVTHKQVGSLTHYQRPILNSTNYTVWAIQIQIILEANGLWESIEPTGDTQPDVRRDKATIAYLYQAIPEAVILQVANCKTTKEVWEALKKRHVGVERVQKARLQSLMVEFQMMQMKEDESVDAFMERINTYATKASELGKSLDEPVLIIASIEQSTDLDEVSIDEIVGKLKTYEERIRLKKGSLGDSQDRLMYSRHDNNLGRERRFGNRVRGRDCPRKSQEESNLVQEDKEQTLLMAIIGDEDGETQVDDKDKKKNQRARD